MFSPVSTLASFFILDISGGLACFYSCVFLHFRYQHWFSPVSTHASFLILDSKGGSRLFLLLRLSPFQIARVVLACFYSCVFLYFRYQQWSRLFSAVRLSSCRSPMTATDPSTLHVSRAASCEWHLQFMRLVFPGFTFGCVVCLGRRYV